ncbi:MAG: DUF4403 family protein, partial [Thermoanaerobaculia bacterium]
IRVSLAQVARDIDTRVAARVSDRQRQNGIDIEYDVSRDPIRVAMNGAGLHSSTTIRYSLEACRGRFPCVSCGRRETPREAQITLHTALQWDASWRLRSSTRLLPVHYPKRCEVTWFDFDVTSRYVAPVIEQQLRSAAALIDREVPELTNVRPTAANVWTLLQKPYEIAPRTWLTLDPTNVALSPVHGNGTIAETTLQLQAFTRVTVGEPPKPQLRPLPALRPANPSVDGLRIPFDLLLPYAEASRIATRDFGRRTYKIEGRDLEVEELELGPGPGGKVRLTATIHYRGGRLRDYHGPVTLEGTPQLDPATSMLIVPDLDYTLDPGHGNAFRRAVERAAHDNVRIGLRRTARFALASQLASSRGGLSSALNRPLGPGVELRGTITAIAPVSITPLADAVSIRFLATGSAEVRTK